jgi:acetoin utilization deacetylase AcuC-like enzyme
MEKIKVFFTNNMLKESKSFSPSSYKPKLVLKDWMSSYSDQLEVSSFNKLTTEDLYLAHDKTYVDGILNGDIKNGFGFKDKEFAKTFHYTSASLYSACEHALRNKIAISPTSGFHHARYNKAEGFCTFNGLIISSMLLKKNLNVNKIGILDFDMHYGNGTDEIINKLNLDYIEHYTAGKYYDLHYPAVNFIKPAIKLFYNRLFKPKKNGSTPIPKLRQKILKGKNQEFLNELPQILERFKKCDILIYQAGADQHINDPYGGLLTYEELIGRDKLVFEFCKANDIPIVWNLAGGYQKDNKGTIEPILLCHRNTMKACLEVFSQ